MSTKVKLSEEEERKRKARMTSRLCVLFAVLDFAILSVVIFEILQLF